MANDEARATLFITGKVQGVFYRASAMERAQSLSLVGYVTNLPDGAVELVTEGPRYAIEQLVEWCQGGPPAAEVDEVRVRWGSPIGEFRTFSIKR